MTGALSAHSLLLVDDEAPVRESLELLLEDRFRVLQAGTGEDALRLLEDEEVDLVILDLTMPGMGGMEALRRIRELPGAPEVVILSATDSARLGIQAVGEGAFDYLTKPFDNAELLEVLRRALEKKMLQQEVSYLRSEVDQLGGFGSIVGTSPGMKAVFEVISKVSRSDSNVLITGESGTGKELVARAIHSRGIRAGGPFIPVNCAAIPPELLESEFFGHEKGAFTGAQRRQVGKFDLAHQGILFLDEISSLRLELQAKLLRVIQHREFTRVGGHRPLRVDIQVIAATNRDLKAMAQEGAFREDLFYRLNVVPIHLPPLRVRREDIPALVGHFLQHLNFRLKKSIPGVTPPALQALSSYYWPGNVRELENLLERMVVLSDGDRPIDLPDLPLEFTLGADSPSRIHSGEKLERAQSELERRLILATLKETGGNQSQAARLLGIHRNTLIKKLSAMKVQTRKK